LDVAQVSRILGHASITVTLDVYTHLFDEARHTREIRTLMASSAFVGVLGRRATACSQEVVGLPAVTNVSSSHSTGGAL
jgi:hypothetical protein